jgi:tetratricopeptide (TPR) repeat protein
MEIDLSGERLLAIASRYVDEHNLIGALKMLNKNAILNGNDGQSYMLYAEVFDDMRLYEKSVNYWFKYIDYSDDYADLSDAYEGLALCFLDMNEDNYAAYYYNKLLMETAEELTSEDREEIINTFLRADNNQLRIVYPPKLADYSKEIEYGLNFMRANDYEKAISQFEQVDEQNEKYSQARNFIAMCNIICDKNDQAEQECLAILAKNPNDVQSLTTLAAVKKQQNKCDESKELAYRLLKIGVKNSDEIYKVATVCCENGLHEEAYNLFCRLDDEYTYDTSLLFFKAISAYNCGKIEVSLEIFDQILTISPDAVTAEYFMGVVKLNRRKKPEKRATLDYFYRLPQDEREANLQILTVYDRLSKADAAKLDGEMDISSCIKWCFDEGSGAKSSYELQLLGARCAIKAGLEDMVRDILLNPEIVDFVKVDILNDLIQLNEGKTYGVVICNLYKRIAIPPLHVQKLKKKIFLKAYASLVSRFAILNADYVYLINSAASKLYFRLSATGKLDVCKDVPSLTAAIYKLSDIRDTALKEEDICSFFGAKESNYKTILGE